jgi:hypothetical protein
MSENEDDDDYWDGYDDFEYEARPLCVEGRWLP